MLVTLLPMVALVRPVQSLNAFIPDAGDAVGNGDARQATAATECVTPDAGDAVGNGEITASTWASNQHSANLVEQQWSDRTVIWIVGSNHNARQATAVPECVHSRCW